MYQRILVPVDGSATATQGLDEAIALAKLTGGKLCLFHVIDGLSLVVGYEGFPAYAGELVPRLKDNGMAILEGARARAKAAGIDAETVLNEGYAGRVSEYVVEQAKAWPADLIVIGTHGHRGIQRVLIGSDAEQIVRSAPVPVLLIRAPEA